MRTPLLITASILTLAGCAVPLPTETADSRDIGVIAGVAARDPHIVMPDSARAGADFVISVRTYGSGCTTRHSTQLVQQGRTVDVVPFDQTTQRELCPTVLQTLEHGVTTRFAAPGAASVRVTGRHMQGGLVTYERQIIVY
jgi:hypothetical protein